MPKKITFTPEQLCLMQKKIKEAEENMATSANQAHMLITLAILIDLCEWSADDVNWFTDKYEEFLGSYSSGVENLHELNKQIFDYCGVAVMDVYEEVEDVN